MEDKPQVSVDLLAEFQALREEILHRLRTNVMLMTFNVTASGVIIGYGFSHDSQIFLITPLVTSLFGLFIIGQNTRIYELGDYIRTNLEPRINQTCSFQVLGWESYFNRVKEHFWSNFWIVPFPVLGATVIPSLISLFLWAKETSSQGLSTWIFLTVDIALLILMVEEYVRRTFSNPNKKSQIDQRENLRKTNKNYRQPPVNCGVECKKKVTPPIKQNRGN